jgi:hypothetical protein
MMILLMNYAYITDYLPVASTSRLMMRLKSLALLIFQSHRVITSTSRKRPWRTLPLKRLLLVSLRLSPRRFNPFTANQII